MITLELVDNSLQVPDPERFYGTGRNDGALPVIPRAVTTGGCTTGAGEHLALQPTFFGTITEIFESLANIRTFSRVLVYMAEMNPVKIGI